MSPCPALQQLRGISDKGNRERALKENLIIWRYVYGSVEGEDRTEG